MEPETPRRPPRWEASEACAAAGEMTVLLVETMVEATSGVVWDVRDPLSVCLFVLSAVFFFIVCLSLVLFCTVHNLAPKCQESIISDKNIISMKTIHAKSKSNEIR